MDGPQKEAFDALKELGGLTLDYYDALCDGLDGVSASFAYLIVVATALYLIFEGLRR